MRVLILVGILTTFALPANAGGSCCHDGNCCASAACCASEHTSATAATTDPSPAREYARVNFVDPVWVGGKVLMGEYIIEHDMDRMEHGGPCTHIYAANNRRTPVVTFYCRHLRRPAANQASVTLRREYNAGVRSYVLTEFQFAGGTDAHGVPGVRGVPYAR